MSGGSLILGFEKDFLTSNVCLLFHLRALFWALLAFSGKLASVLSFYIQSFSYLDRAVFFYRIHLLIRIKTTEFPLNLAHRARNVCISKSQKCLKWNKLVSKFWI